MDELRINLSSLPEDVREKLVAFLQALGISIESKPVPSPKPKPITSAHKPVYMNLYTVRYVSPDKYEGEVERVFSCYSIGKPIDDPQLLKEHHLFFYPDHEIIEIEPYGSFERPNIGRAKLVYNADTNEWEEIL